MPTDTRLMASASNFLPLRFATPLNTRAGGVRERQMSRSGITSGQVASDRVRAVTVRDRERRGEGKPETFTFLGFTHFCGHLTSRGTLDVWRITAKKRMAAKLNVIKAVLQRRKHHRTSGVGAWLRKVVQGYYQTMRCRATPLSCAPSGGVYADCGDAF
jgi:hypothetical protein